MASFTSDAELNIGVNAITSAAQTCRIHTGIPGNNGTASRIGSLSQNLAAATWSAASGGDSAYGAAVDFGVVDSNSAQTVTHYSRWQGNTFLGWGSITSTAVPAGDEFSINSGEIAVNAESVSS